MKFFSELDATNSRKLRRDGDRQLIIAFDNRYGMKVSQILVRCC